MTKRPNDIINSKKVKRRIHHHQEQNLDKEQQEQQRAAIVFPTIDPSSEQTSNINFGKPNCIAKPSSSSIGSQKTLHPLKELSVQITTSSSKAAAEQQKPTTTTVTTATATATALLVPSPSLANSKRNSPLSRDLEQHREQKLGYLCIQPAAAKKAAQTIMVTPNESTKAAAACQATTNGASPTTKTTTPLTRPGQGVEVREASSSSSSSLVARNIAESSFQVLSSFSSRRKPKRKVFQPSLDCFLVTAIFSTIFLMVGNFQIGK